MAKGLFDPFLSFQNLCTLFYFEQMLSRLTGLDLVVILVYIMGYGQDHTLCRDIIQTAVSIASRSSCVLPWESCSCFL